MKSLEESLQAALTGKAATLPPFTVSVDPAIFPTEPVPVAPTAAIQMRILELQQLLPVLRVAAHTLETTAPRYENNIRYIRELIEAARAELKMYGSAEIPVKK